MKPQQPNHPADLFRSQLAQMLNMPPPLVRLSERMNGRKLEAEMEDLYISEVGQPPLLTYTRLAIKPRLFLRQKITGSCQRKV